MTCPARTISVPVPNKIAFDKPLENVRYFRKQWSCFCKATGIDSWPEENKVNYLYLVIGSEAFRIISSLSLSDEEQNNSETILTALEDHCKRPKNVILERYKFNQAVQNEGEDVDSYLTRLRELARTCEYGENVEDMIRDRFVVGLRNLVVQQELVADRTLTLQKAVSSTQLRLQTDANLHSLYQKINHEKNVAENDNIVPQIDRVIDQALPHAQIKLENMDEEENSTSVNSIVQLHVAPSVSSTCQEVLNAKSDTNIIAFEPPDKRLRLDGPLINLMKDVPVITRKEEEYLPEKRTDIVTNPCIVVCTIDYNIGSFLVLKTDYHNDIDPPLWKIDSNSLLQKFEPFEQDGMVLYKSKSVYSGWSQNARNLYYRVTVLVKGKHANRKESIVQFLSDLVEQDNVIEKKNKSMTPCEKKNGILKKR